MISDTLAKQSAPMAPVADNDNDTVITPAGFVTPVADNDNIVVSKGTLSLEMRQALARMIDDCERRSKGVKITKRGAVIDTQKDISAQLMERFQHIDITEIVEEFSFTIAEQAKDSGQRFQEVMLAYVDDGIPPKLEGANKHTFVKCYSPEAITVSGGTGSHSLVCKAPWGGGAGDGSDLSDMVKMGVEKFFTLSIAALDSNNERDQSLLADMAVVQAFGGMPGAVDAVADVVAAGGPDGKKMEAIIEQMVEIKTLKQALLDAGTGPQATGIAAALAVKTEALSIAMPALSTVVPAVAMTAMGKQVEGVKTEMTARQMAHAIEAIAVAPLPANNIVTNNVMRAVEAVKASAVTHNLSVADAVHMVITQTAPAEISAPMKALTTLLAETPTLPAIERSVTPEVAQSIRADLITPPLALAASTPVQPEIIIQSIAQIAQQTGNQNLADVSVKLAEIVATAGQSTVPPTMAVQAVVENLQGIALSNNAPAGLQVIIPQLEAVVVQLRDPAPVQVNPISGPVHVSPVAPLPVLENIGGGGEPRRVVLSPTPWEPVPQDNGWRSQALKTDGQKTAPAHWADKGFGKPANEVSKVEAPKAEATKEAGCGGKTCKACFTKSCQALPKGEVDKMLKDYKQSKYFDQFASPAHKMA